MLIKKNALQLAATYLIIIMVMSIGFSLIFFGLSTHELGRRPRGMSPETTVIEGGSLQDYFDRRERESRGDLALNLVMVNLVALIVGGLLSYLLAERTLKPIEENMEAQMQFVSDASHELRTPLTALRTANEVALRDAHLKLSTAKEVIAENIDDITRLQHLTDSMLGLLREDDTSQLSSTVSLQDIFSQAINLIIPQAMKKNIAIEDTGPALQVRGSEQSLVQLITILLDNAVKYSPQGSTVHITSSQKGRAIYVAIRDEGIGMDEATLESIFTRFYRADQSRSETIGYGLGLAIAKKIVTAHKGSIEATSTPGQGSTFTVILNSAN